jgi:tRNA threonylcarbamoyl adenosine modification protein YeaZ
MQTDESVTLALDSSSSPLLLALKANGKIRRARKSGLKQEDYLFPLLKKLLDRAGLKLGDVKRFFFVKGPGRFTGIRIGITLASMLKEISGADIASASVFDILRARAQEAKEYKTWLQNNPGGAFAVVLHALREEYFAAIYGAAPQPQWLGFEALLDFLKTQNQPLFIAGWGRERSPLSAVLPAAYTYAPARLNKIDAPTMLQMAALPPRPAREVLEPLYLKPARFEIGK